MTEKKEPAPAPAANVPATLSGFATAKYDEKTFDSLAASSDFLPRLQLMTSQTEKAKDGSVTVNNYALIESSEKLVDLGKEVDVAVLSWRPKALDTSEMVSSYDPESDLFNQIKDKSFIQNSGCMFGLEFLVYIGSKGKFATFFMGNKSARRTAMKVKDYMARFATFTSQKIQTTKHTWFAPAVQDCATEFPIPMEDAKIEVEKFNNPVASGVETTGAEERER